MSRCSGLVAGFAAVFALTASACGCRATENILEQANSPSEAPPSEPEEPIAAEPPAPALPPLPAHAVLDDQIRAARDLAQRRLLRAAEPLLPDLPPLPAGPLPGANQPHPPDGLPGFFVPLLEPQNADPLARFEAALAELDAGARAGPVRVAVYGASGVATDMWTGYLRAYLQIRFGDGGPGIVAAAPPNKWSRHQEIVFESSKHWTKQNSFRLGDRAPTDYFGLMGQAMSAESSRAWTQVQPAPGSPSATKLAFYELHYLEQPRGGSFTLLLDGKTLDDIHTAAPTVGVGHRRVELELGSAHTLRIQLHGDGKVRLLGVVAETETPGVVLDTLGVNGAKSEDQAKWDEPLWSSHLRERDPVLYVLAYGNNESVDVDVPIAQYEQHYRASLERFRRALPDAGCLMIGPGDYPHLVEGELRPRPRLGKIREVQQRLAPEYGCAFLDTLAVFGGKNSKLAWVAAGLGKNDYLHMTRLGYLRFGMAVGDALMQRHDWRALHAVRTTSSGSAPGRASD
ncbi:GDSL-type esterase/lipase family protein [Enhygromyxa salina]|nr:GDSL-type esterase/lipase family protein [Enhygromyxa salina]